jgi:hypothetical protein
MNVELKDATIYVYAPYMSHISSLKKLSGPLDILFRLKRKLRLHLFIIKSE